MSGPAPESPRPTRRPPLVWRLQPWADVIYKLAAAAAALVVLLRALLG